MGRRAVNDFDDLFLHSAYNKIDNDRIVLFVDLERIDLPAKLAHENQRTIEGIGRG